MRARLIALAALAIACGEPEASTPTAPVAPPPAPAPPPPPPTRAGPTCTYHGVCWANPLPQGNTLRSIVAVAPDLVIAVGDRGTILRWDGTAWALEDTPSRERLNDVWAADRSTIVAVGDHGTILRRTARREWEALVSGTDATLRSVWGRGSGELWAVGDAGTILRIAGASGAREPLPEGVPPDASLVDVEGHGDAIHALALRPALGEATIGASRDRDPILLTRTGDGWRALPAIDGDATSIWIDPAGGLVLGGDQARHGDGTTWRARSFGADRPLDAVWGLAADDVWAGGYEGRVSHWDGHAWRDQRLDTRLDVLAIAGTSATDAWAVGEHGLLARWDGTAWTIVSSGSTARLEGVFGLDASDVWAVGDHASLHWDGRAWSPLGPDDVELEALAGTGRVMVAVGADGAVRRFSSGVWSAPPTGTHAKLEGVWLRDATHAVAVGAEQWVEEDDATWSPVEDRPEASAIWGSSERDAWAVGAEGVSHWDGSAWSPTPGTGGAALFGVWGRAPDDVYAVGAEGRVLHYDGTTWSPITVPTTQDLVGVWGRAPHDVWIVGHHGTILHFDGLAWHWRDSGTDELLHAIWGDASGVWIVGHGGAILRIAS